MLDMGLFTGVNVLYTHIYFLRTQEYFVCYTCLFFHHQQCQCSYGILVSYFNVASMSESTFIWHIFIHSADMLHCCLSQMYLLHQHQCHVYFSPMILPDSELGPDIYTLFIS